MVDVPENSSAMLYQKLPLKKKDPGMFTIPCTIGNMNIKSAMLDLGASINVTPLFIYTQLSLGSIRETRGVILLVNDFSTYPKGMVDDVLVQDDSLIFSTDPYIMDMDDEDSHHSSLILLERLFPSTAGAKIDVPNFEIIFEVRQKVVHFYIDPG